jgi:uncharacterized protein (TIGR03437 family)
MYFAVSLTALSILTVSLAAQTTAPYTIQTVAGTTRNLGDGGPAIEALLWSPNGVSVDAAGNIYIADTGDARIRRVSPDGTITTVAGTFAGFAGDGGPATSAELSDPSKAIVAPNGSIYIADTSNSRIRVIGPDGTIQTVAGTGTGLSGPRDVAVDAAGNLYIADTNNGRIRRVAHGQLTTIAGSGLFGYQGDEGPAVNAAFASPRGVAVDGQGNVYVADTINNRVREIAIDGTITTIAGGANAGFSGDGRPAVLAALTQPTSVAVDSTGNVYVADTGNDRIRRIGTDGIITTIAGTGTSGFTGDGGPAIAAELNEPESVAVDRLGNVYIADTGNDRIREVSAAGVITTVAGSDPAAGNNGPAVSARLFEPSGVARDAAGNLYIADSLNNEVRKVTPQGVIVDVAGNGTAGYAGDGGLATRAELNDPNGLALDAADNLYIADTANNVIREVTPYGTISTIAGTGAMGNSGDGGPATSATLFNPNAVAFDRAGNMYIADSANHRVRVVDASGNIRNFAGDPSGLPGPAVDNVPPTATHFNYPRSLAIDAQGTIYIADYFNNRIRKIVPGTNVITTFAGTGTGGFSGDGGLAASAELNLPAAVALDASGNVYVADLLNNRIRQISANGVIRTIAGGDFEGFGGDGGAATDAILDTPRDLTVTPQGAVYFTDQYNNRVRELMPGTITLRTVVNAASLIAGAVAPGEAVTITGVTLGPTAGLAGSSTGGLIGTTLGGTEVLFDGIPAPLLYASNTQINAIVPYQVAGEATTNIQVKYGGLVSAQFTLPVQAAAPGIFTIDTSGSGQAAALNQDQTVNSALNPAARGSVISIFGTGDGVPNPPALTGQVVTAPYPQIAQPVTVRIEGQPAQITYAGEAPGAAGAFQINAIIPDGVVPSDKVTVQLNIGLFAAQQTTTIAVQ